jgi:hypothetical protein
MKRTIYQARQRQENYTYFKEKDNIKIDHKEIS